jgi:hypothetical protein
MPYYQLHPDQGMNFQMNRVLTYGQEAGCLEEIKAIAARIADYESWYSEWVALAHRAEEEQRFLHAAYAYRMAEFILPEGRPEKLACYQASRTPSPARWESMRLNASRSRMQTALCPLCGCKPCPKGPSLSFMAATIRSWKSSI